MIVLQFGCTYIIITAPRTLGHEKLALEASGS
jgi:hypothetical protein